MTSHLPNEARVVPLRPPAARPPAARPQAAPRGSARPASDPPRAADALRPGHGVPAVPEPRTPAAPAPREPLWRDLVGDVLRRERLAQERTLKDVAEAARISMPYLSEVERGRKEASSEVLAAAAHALGLTLGDLLARAHGELVRVTSRYAAAGRTVSPASHDGLCLAA
ncbi:helix-turn-helix domain-containing protein [Streptomyces sp. NPDC085946]|uniref:helix-turn-helix domain-containing protein n=1 Tax=Streptomyces sp. NPDC085946 TaxID=3365744 RepID=UPI0037D6D6A3